MSKSIADPYEILETVDLAVNQDVRAEDIKRLFSGQNYIGAHKGMRFGGISYDGTLANGGVGRDDTEITLAGYLQIPIEGTGYKIKADAYCKQITIDLDIYNADNPNANISGTSDGKIDTLTLSRSSSSLGWVDNTITIAPEDATQDLTKTGDPALIEIRPTFSDNGGTWEIGQIDVIEGGRTSSELVYRITDPVTTVAVVGTNADGFGSLMLFEQAINTTRYLSNEEFQINEFDEGGESSVVIDGERIHVFYQVEGATDDLLGHVEFDRNQNKIAEEEQIGGFDAPVCDLDAKIDSSGTIWVVGASKSPTATVDGIEEVNGTTGSWSSPTNISTDADDLGATCRIEIDSTGTKHAVWFRASGQDSQNAGLAYSQNSGSGWSTPENLQQSTQTNMEDYEITGEVASRTISRFGLAIDESGTTPRPRILVGENGSTNNERIIQVYEDGSGNWNDEVLFENDDITSGATGFSIPASIDCEVDSTGVVYLFYQSHDAGIIKYWKSNSSGQFDDNTREFQIEDYSSNTDGRRADYLETSMISDDEVQLSYSIYRQSQNDYQLKRATIDLSNNSEAIDDIATYTATSENTDTPGTATGIAKIL